MKKHNENEEPIELNTDGEEEVILDGDVDTSVELPKDEEPQEAEGDAEAQEIPEEAEESEEDKTAAELAELKDRYMRLLAEYDNFRRRTQKEKEALYLDSVAEVVKEWLPLVDDIERAVASSENMPLARWLRRSLCCG